MHPGIFNGPKSPLMHPRWNGQFQECIENTSGFYDCTWLMRPWNWNSTLAPTNDEYGSTQVQTRM